MSQQPPGNGSKKKSTTVRAPWHIRAGFTAAERLAPGPAAEYLSRQWFRLPAPPERRLRGRAPADAQEFTLDCLGTDVWGYDWGEGPPVYLIHGWGGSTGDFDFIAANLVANGRRVVAFDAPSHGNSGPGPWGHRHANAVHLVEAAAAAFDKFGEPEAIVAHSMGCLTSAMALRRDGVDTTGKRLALLAPFIGGTDGFADTLNSIVPVGPRILERLIPLAETRADVELSQITLTEPPLRAATLVVHDRGDRPNPFSHGQALAESWPNTELMATSGLGHRKVLLSPAVSGRVTGFLNER